jgi:alkyl hydroperoxide reductase 1
MKLPGDSGSEPNNLCAQIITLSDTNAAWSDNLGLSMDLTDRGLGIRTARYAMIIDNLVVKYVEVRVLAMIAAQSRDPDGWCA